MITIDYIEGGRLWKNIKIKYVILKQLPLFRNMDLIQFYFRKLHPKHRSLMSETVAAKNTEQLRGCESFHNSRNLSSALHPLYLMKTKTRHLLGECIGIFLFSITFNDKVRH